MAGHPESRRPIRLGISSCLLGEKVRFDGGHKRDLFVTAFLSRHFEWVPVCPEVESGMGIPREPVRLVGDADRPRLRGATSGKDHTAAMEAFSRFRVRALAAMDLSGYIFKSRSPSCGARGAKLYAGGRGAGRAVGIFARHVLDAFPWLPVEEEMRLNDPRIRDSFLERVFCYRRWRDRLREGPTPARLAAFHRAHKVLLLAHSPGRAAKLERIVAQAKGTAPARRARAYGDLFFETLARRATPARHAGALRHMAGHFKRLLPAADRRQLDEIIENYRRGCVPLVVPITLIRYFARKYDLAYLQDQVYLNPHPKELMLRNHA